MVKARWVQKARGHFLGPFVLSVISALNRLDNPLAPDIQPYSGAMSKVWSTIVSHLAIFRVDVLSGLNSAARRQQGMSIPKITRKIA